MPAPTPPPAEVLGKIPPETRQRRHFPAILIFGFSYLAFLTCLAVAMVVPYWAKPICVLGATFMVGGLYVIAHDAGHGTFVPGRRANAWIARLAFLPSLTPLAGWYRAHVLLHHNYLRVRGKDMVWMPWTLEEYRSAPRWRRWWYRFMRTPLGLATYWTVGNWVPYLLFPPGSEMGGRRRQQHFDRLLVVVYVVSLLAALYTLRAEAQNWPWATPAREVGVPLIAVVFPYLFWSISIAVVDLVQHTHPRAVWFASRKDWDYYTANVASTTHMLLPLGLSGALHNILRHTAHHSDPRVPLYHLPEAQAALEREYGKDIIVEWFTPRYVLRLLRTCRLYDYEQRQWLDYDGKPTGPAHKPNEGAT